MLLHDSKVVTKIGQRNLGPGRTRCRAGYDFNSGHFHPIIVGVLKAIGLLLCYISGERRCLIEA